MVAVVSEAPVRPGRITKVEFRHALMLGSVQAGLKSVPKPGDDGYERLKEQALHNLFEATWLVGEAAEMGIEVTRREVAHEVAQLRKTSFKSNAEYLRFLRESRYTRRDVRERVEL